MNTYIKHTSLAVLLLSLIYFSGCSKSTPVATTTAPSLIGTWGLISEGEKLLVNGVQKWDTSINVPPGTGAFTFASNGYFAEYYPTGVLGGPYTYSGTALSLLDTTAATNKWIYLTVDTLSANSLSFHEGADSTKTGSLDSVFYIYFNLTR